MHTNLYHVLLKTEQSFKVLSAKWTMLLRYYIIIFHFNLLLILKTINADLMFIFTFLKKYIIIVTYGAFLLFF